MSILLELLFQIGFIHQSTNYSYATYIASHTITLIELNETCTLKLICVLVKIVINFALMHVCTHTWIL